MGLDIIILFAGVILGIALHIIFGKKPTPAGYLNIVESNEPGENPYLFLDLDISVNAMQKEKYVTFKISLK